MAVTKKDLDVVKNCFLVKPGKERSKYMLCFQNGQMSEVNTSHDDNSERPAVYLHKDYKDEFYILLRNTEIALKKAKVFGASSQLAELVILMGIANRQSDMPMTLDQMVTKVKEIEAIVFVGIPLLAVTLSDCNDSFLEGFRAGRFTSGTYAFLLRHDYRDKLKTAKSKASSPDMPSAGAYIVRDPNFYRILPAAFDVSMDSRVCSLYLNYLIQCLAREFQTEFSDDQSIPVALGAPSFDVDALFQLNDLRIEVAFPEYGFESVVLMNFGQRLIPSNVSEIGLKDQLRAELISNRPLGSCPDIDRKLATFSRFLVKAKSHESGSRNSDAFIHCVFALDLALGGKTDTTKNTTRRAAAVYSASMKVPFKTAERELREIFDMRSKYVHEGKEIEDQKFAQLLQICGLVTECLLRARSSLHAESKDFISDYWYPRLDLVVASMAAGVELNGQCYVECGLSSPSVSTLSLVH